MFGRFTERHPDESSFKPLESSSSSDSAFDGGPRFIPGRAGVTVGYLLPLGRELQFNFEEPPDTDTAECDRFHALMLLSCWEETIEAHERASYWIAKKEHEKEEKEGNAKLKAAAQEMMLGFGVADERAKKDALVVAAEAFADGTDFAFDKANASGGSTKRSKGSPSPFGSLKEEGSTKPLKALFSK